MGLFVYQLYQLDSLLPSVFCLLSRCANNRLSVTSKPKAQLWFLIVKYFFSDLSVVVSKLL